MNMHVEACELIHVLFHNISASVAAAYSSELFQSDLLRVRLSSTALGELSPAGAAQPDFADFGRRRSAVNFPAANLPRKS